MTPLRAAREAQGYAREKVVAQLDPPLTSKTLERWERDGVLPKRNGARRIYLPQLARIYKCRQSDLELPEAVAA